MKYEAVVLPDGTYGAPDISPTTAFGTVQDIRNSIRAGFICVCEQEKTSQQLQKQIAFSHHTPPRNGGFLRLILLSAFCTYASGLDHRKDVE